MILRDSEKEEIIIRKVMLGMLLSFEAVPFCIIPGHPDAMADLGYLRRERTLFTPVQDSTQDWAEVRRAIKRKGACCPFCSLDLICEGPWEEYIDAFGSDEFKPLNFDPVAVTKLLSAVVKKSGS